MGRGNISKEMDPSVATRIGYTWTKLSAVVTTIHQLDESAYLCHRKDYHRDGSESDYYYLSLDQKLFLEMGGEELLS